MKTSDVRRELIKDLIDQTQALLGELGVAEREAEHCALALADMITEHWGGQVLYIPLDYRVRLSQRERDIYDAYRAGISKDELAQVYKLTPRSINRCIARAATRYRVDAQLDLFAAQPDALRN